MSSDSTTTDVSFYKGFMGLVFDDRPIDAVVDSLILAAKRGVITTIYFVNAHCVNVAQNDEKYKDILRKMPYLYADGIGMEIAARICGTSLDNNNNGTDMFPVLCKKTANRNISIALFGAKHGVAQKCADRMTRAYPGLSIAWTHHGYETEGEQLKIIDEINTCGADILLVAKGVPNQEKWIDENRSKIEVPVVMGVGALLDFYSGNCPRAPRIVRTMRMEWMFRLAIEPRRLFKRYIVGNPVFIYRILKHRSTGNC